MSRSSRKRSRPFRFIHTADLHLGTCVQGVRGLNENVQKELANSTYQAWGEIVDQCIRKEVDFLLVAGDVYDSTDKNIQAQLQFRNGLKKLDDKGIKAYVVHGNHDPDDGWSRSVDLPENTVVFPSSEPLAVEHLDQKDRAIAKIVGMSFPTAHIKENLVRHFPPRKKGWPFTIGLLHCTVGSGEGHELYAPCTAMDLRQCGYDYWALGHIHKPMEIHGDGTPLIYAGNPQGCDIGEKGERGCRFISVDTDGSLTQESLSTAQFRWEEISVDVSDQDNIGTLEDHMRERLAEHAENLGTRVVGRVILTGKTPLHKQLIDDGTQTLSQRLNEEPPGNQIFLERILCNTHPTIDRETVLDRDDILGEICRISNKLPVDDVLQSRLKEPILPLFQITARSYLQEPDDENLNEVFQEAESLLLSLLAEEAEK